MVWDIFQRLTIAKELSFSEGSIEVLGYRFSMVDAAAFAKYIEDIDSNEKLSAQLYRSTKNGVSEGWGPTLLATLDSLTVPIKPIDKPLRMPIQDVFSIFGFGTVPVGRVETGVMKPGDQIIVMPSGIKTEVKSIEMHHKQLAKAEPGDNVGFNIKGVEKKDIKRGDVVGPASNPPTVATEFTAQIIVLHHQNVIARGYTPVFHIHTAQIACTIVDILEKKDPKTGQTLEKNPETIKTGDVAIVKIKPSKPICVEKSSDFPQLGRFAIRDMGETVGAGLILDITAKQ